MALADAIDQDWLQRRRRFCEARIKARAESSMPGPILGILAGLQRELSAIALLQGDIQAARSHLTQTGELLLKQTNAQGLVYLGLAGFHRVSDDPVARTIVDVAARLDEPRGPDQPRVKGAQFYSPIQWLSVVQAKVLAHQDDTNASLLVRRLRPQGSLTLGNGLPLGLYLDLLAPRDETSAAGDGRLEDFATVLTWRRRNLRIARENTYHWRTMLDPAALVDFDLVTLFLSRPIPEVLSPPALKELGTDDLEWLPLVVAESLRGYGPDHVQPG